MEKTVVLKNETGLHARPAGIFVKAASQFASKIQIRAKDQTINAKSIMNILSLGLETGSECPSPFQIPRLEREIFLQSFPRFLRFSHRTTVLRLVLNGTALIVADQ